MYFSRTSDAVEYVPVGHVAIVPTVHGGLQRRYSAFGLAPLLENNFQ